MILLLAFSFSLLLLIRLIERPCFGLQRPLTPYITQFVCRNTLRVFGIGHEVHGVLMKHHGAVVANHVSWLDILALNASKRIYFVSKSEVAKWPGIGWLAQGTGTLFVDRERGKALEHTALVESRLKAGHKLLFFPEGTSTDGLTVTRFKSTLFEAFMSEQSRDSLYIQPVVIIYLGPDQTLSQFYSWWGEMEFAEHLLRILAAKAQGTVRIKYLPPVRTSDFADRKSLAYLLETEIRSEYYSQMQSDSDRPNVANS
ncbi:MAG: lysophospholipid acyltransferase family protein [Aestuariivita sp.]|nr:lysophospholipid acyltransferase family protein [Aestuariivita sp.]MCY4289040.1 lysophospholipid acyltransferase family protein [Aestuariivita sp.]